MTDVAYFTAVDEAPGRYRPSDHVRGPWSADLMHAGPPSALIAHVMTGLDLPRPGMLTRFSVEILRPVPVADVVVRVRAVRRGSRVALVEGVLSETAQNDPLMLARAWFMRAAGEPVAVPDTPVLPPPSEWGELRELPPWWGTGYLDSVEWRWVAGSFESPGPATVWARPRYPLVAGHQLRPAERVLVVADSGSGISAVASPRDLTFVNTDLTLHLHREPQGEVVWLRAQSTLDPAGVGLAATTLGDAAGSIGQCAQSLFVAPSR